MMVAVTERATPIQPDINAEAQRLLAAIDRAGLGARLIGGMAIRLLAADRLPAAYERPIHDLDFILAKRDRPQFNILLIDGGARADRAVPAAGRAARTRPRVSRGHPHRADALHQSGQRLPHGTHLGRARPPQE